MNEDIIINIRVQLLEAQRQLAKFSKNTKADLNQVAKAQQEVYVQQKKLNTALNGAPFQGWAMSLMFAGMALQRVSSTIMKFGTKAFQEISHSVEGTVTNFDILEGSMKYLGYTVGAALEPMIAFLIPIIDALADWVDKNPGLTAFAVTLLGILGTIGMIGGMAKLAITNGLVPMFAIMQNGMLALGVSFASLIPLLLPLGLILGAILLLWATDLGNFRKFFTETFGGIWLVIKDMFKNMVQIIKDILGIFVAIFKGDFDKVKLLTEDLGKRLVKIVLDALILIGVAFVNIFILSLNVVNDLIFKAFANMITGLQTMFLNAMIWIVEKIRNLFDKLGLGTGFLDKGIAALEKMKSKVNDVKEVMNGIGEKLKIDYISKESVQTGLSNVDALLNLNQKPSSNQTVSNVTNNITNVAEVKIEKADNWTDFNSGLNMTIPKGV